MIEYHIPEFCKGYTRVTGSELSRIAKETDPRYIIIDTETYYNPNNRNAVIRFIGGAPNNEPFGFAVRFEGQCYWVTEELHALSELLEMDTVFVNQNMKYDFHMIGNIELPIPKDYHDTMIMIQILDPEHMCIRPDGTLKKTKALKNMGYHYLEAKGKLRGKIDLRYPQMLETQVLEEYVDKARSDIAKERGIKKEEVSYKDVNDVYPELMMYYACVDTHIVDILWEPLLDQIVKEDQYQAYKQDLDANIWLLNMERRGIRIDTLLMQRDEQLLNTLVSEIEPEIIRLAGRSFNINSAQDLVSIYEDRFHIKWEWFTDKGQPNTTKATLENIPFIKGDVKDFTDLILLYRLATHIRDTYIIGIYPLIQNGRIHCDLLLAPMDDSSGATVTGRLSSRNPNLQNIPKRPVEIEYKDTKLVIRPRSYYIPDEGCVFVRCDGDQQEYRALGHYSNDRAFMKIIQEGKDIHKGTAAMIYNVPYDEVTKAQRDVGKTTNFALVYQLGNAQYASNMGKPIDLEKHKMAGKILYKAYAAFNLPPYKYNLNVEDVITYVMLKYNDEELDKMYYGKAPSRSDIAQAIGYFFSPEACEAIQFAIDSKKAYFDQFPDMKQFLEDVKKTAKQRGWVKNYYGRKYFFKNPAEESYKAPNYVIQGGCSGICKDRGVAVDEYLRKHAKSKLTYSFLPIHDEIAYQVHISDIDVAKKIPGILSDIPFRVPMTWGADWGHDLDERFELEKDEDWSTIHLGGEANEG